MADFNVTLIPSHFEFYDDSKNPMAEPAAMGDNLARLVLDRFRRAAQAKRNNQVFQGKSTVCLMREADDAMTKNYTPAQAQAFVDAFGEVPDRYMGLTFSKVQAIADWKSELVAGDPGALIQIVPTPSPRLPESAVARIKEQVKADLIQRLMNAGIGAPDMLLTPTRRLHQYVRDFIDQQAGALRQIEQGRIASAALSTASEVQVLVRDLALEGNFREAYTGFSVDQVKYGIGVMRFPHWQRRVVFSDRQKGEGRPRREVKSIPTFARVNPWNFFVTPDGGDVSTVSAAMEYREISKMTLVGLLKDPRYDHDAIRDVLDRYNIAPTRTWLFPEADVRTEQGQQATYWDPDEVIAVIYHEGVVSGSDLQAYGLTGYDKYETYDVRLELCGGRAIRVEVVSPTAGFARSYAVTKYHAIGDGVWNAVGVPAILHNSQSRINTLWRLWEENVDWAMRPPRMVNPDALQNPKDAYNIVPGQSYQINEAYIGSGQAPDPIRAIRGATAQYQILFPLMQQIARQADMEVGVPDLSDMSTFGRGSLGELSARVSQAVRRIRNAAFAEDRAMKPIWQATFEFVLDENPHLIENADLDLNYLGINGLLAKEQEQQAKMARLSVIERGVAQNVVPTQAAEFAYNDLLRDLGTPTEALGMTDPLTDRAVAQALAQGQLAAGPSVPMVPQLDGRSGAMSAVPGAVSAPNGAPTLQAPPAL